MDDNLEFKQADKAHLTAWEGLKTTIVYLTGAIIVTLLALAFFFGG